MFTGQNPKDHEVSPFQALPAALVSLAALVFQLSLVFILDCFKKIPSDSSLASTHVGFKLFSFRTCPLKSKEYAF